MTLTHRRAVDRIRSDTARTNRDENWGRRNCSPGFDDVIETVLERDEATRIRASMSVLSPVQHEAVSLAYFSHLTYAEVAEHLRIPVPTAKTRIRDALKKLRATLESQE
jgi:RNA polymerase sigma-70 factor (ECF subfamily)